MSTEQNTPNYGDDEIDLRELVRTLSARKKTIFLVAIVTVSLALAYALVTAPVYKATATFLPPTEADLSHLAVPDIYVPDQQELYQRFAVTLESRKVYRKTFTKLNLINHFQGAGAENADINQEAIFHRFIDQVTLERAKEKKGVLVAPNLFLSVHDKSPEIAAEIANTIAAVANATLITETIQGIEKRIALAKKTLEEDIVALRSIGQKHKMDEIARIKEEDRLKIKEINDQITELKKTHQKKIKDEIEQLKEDDNLQVKEINDKIHRLREVTKQQRLDKVEQLKEADQLATQQLIEQIEVLKNNASTLRKDRINRLEEAAKIAKNAGIIERSNTSSSNSNLDKTTIYAEFNTQEQPLYLRGVKELESEVRELKTREYDDPFIPKLRELQQQLAALENNKEIELLLSRKNDDPFIPELRALQEQLNSLKFNRKIEILLARKNDEAFVPGLRELQEQLELMKNNRKVEVLLARKNNDPFTESLRSKELQLEELKAIELEPKKVSMASFDQPAFPPAAREKPKRSLIVVLGAVLGLFLGIIAAFMQNFWQSMREEEVKG